MRKPVRIGQQQRCRGNAAGQASEHRMKGSIGLICRAVRALRYRRIWLFGRHGGLPVAALVRGTGTKR